LVVETGPLDNSEEFIRIPGSFNVGQYVGFYFSVPQPRLNNRTFPVLSGKVVGGGSVVNAMFLLRGLKEDYDGWKKLGKGDWGWDDLLPFFKKVSNSPRFRLDRLVNLRISTEWHAGIERDFYAPRPRFCSDQ
jgi:choline dehydrogenase